MIIHNGKQLRSLEEQVLKNKQDIEYILEEEGVLNQFGIKVVEVIESTEDMPSVEEYKEEHEDWQYGDAMAVGTEAPYALHILTRANGTHAEDYWFYIGLFPAPSTVPGPKGERGEPGYPDTTGNLGKYLKVGTTGPMWSDLPNDMAVNIKDGSGIGALQQVQDGTSGTVDFTNKNPNATALDATITGNIAYGGTGQYSMAFGGKSVAQGKRSLAEGTTTLAKGNYSHAEGDNSVTLGNDSHAEGYQTVAKGIGSHSEGSNTQAIGLYTHAEGQNTIAKGNDSHAEGNDTTSEGNYAHSEGFGTQANGVSSHAEGNYSHANGEHAHAEGYKCYANGNTSHAGGSECEAIGDNSFAQGRKNIAAGENATTIGGYNTVNASNGVALGLGNYIPSDAPQGATFVGRNAKFEFNSIFAVGNGTSGATSNAMSVSDNGTMRVNAFTDGTTTKTMSEVLAGGGGTKLYAHKWVFEEDWEYGTQSYTLTAVMTTGTPLTSSNFLDYATAGQLVNLTLNGNQDGPNTMYSYADWVCDATAGIRFFGDNKQTVFSKSWYSYTDPKPYKSYIVTEL